MRQFLEKYFKGDRVIWMVIVIMFLMSVLAVYSASGSLVFKQQDISTSYYLFRHGLFLALGFLLVYIFHKIPYRYFSTISQWLYWIAIPLLLFTLLFGVTRNEASRWLIVPGIGIEFQTSDFAKLALILYVARLLAENQKDQNSLKLIFKPIMIATAIICGLILPANFSTSILLFVTIFLLMIVGRVNGQYLLFSFSGAIAAVAILILFIMMSPGGGRTGTWKKRIESFVNSDEGDNYQAEQAKIAIASGGFFGKGPGNSTQRNFLPHPYSDFIFAIILEEYGFFGGISVLLLYLILLYRAGAIVKISTRTFPAFLTIGLTFNIVVQALINMSVAINLFPVTGQPLPLISMGGTSIIFSSISLGIILNISRKLDDTENTEEFISEGLADPAQKKRNA